MSDAPIESLLADYPIVVTMPVQWGDQDAYGHVNNTIYFRWFETARLAYLERLEFHDPQVNGLGPILANIACDFRKQVKYPDTVRMGARVTRLGRSSLTMEHRLVSLKGGGVAAEGTSVLVAFDYRAQKPTPLPEAIRSAIESLEGRRFERA